MTANLDKLKILLAELFMLDQADLDFGIYRVMNAKRAEVTRFLDHDLLPQVRGELEKISTGDRAGIEAELTKAIAAARAAGFTAEQAEQSPKVADLRAQLAATVDVSALENEVLSDLANFFRRYYSGGDFLALRRYKAGVYAIPYEGEEVKLHWANADQYYIKTSEFLRDYTFKLADGKRVNFKLVEADTEADNKKSAAGQERRFILCIADPLVEADGELVIRFEYRPDADKRKQAELNTLASETILNVPGFAAWKSALARLAPTEKNPNRTLLEKHLGDYTARNSFDYFIHKDIGGFLRRELDFYIKNEIMHLDDIEAEDAPRVGQYLAKIKAIRAIARKIIDFLEQLENFQKKLWLKKKFVVETNYCVTLDRVAEALYPEVAANDAQWQEWEKLFTISEIAPDLFNQKKQSRDAKFLKANSFLVLDTKFFPAEFKEKLLADNKVLGGAATLDEATDGLVIHSENFNALNLLQARYREKVKCAYFDPPYNTGTDGFPYKDSYRHSSWLSMFSDRLKAARALLKRTGAAFVSIDENEISRLRALMEDVFGESNFLTDLIWQGSSKNDQKYFSICHEYIAVALRDKEFLDQSEERWMERKEGLDDIYTAFEKIKEEFPGDFKAQEEALKQWYSDLKPSNPAKAHSHYCRVERRGIYFPDNISKPAKGYYYDVIHPVTKQPCTKPKGGWRFIEETMKEQLAQDLIHFGEDHTSVPCRKSFLRETEFMSPRTVIYQDGRAATGMVRDLFGNKDVFANPKDKNVLGRIFTVSAQPTDVFLDPFGGSGTTAHSLIDLNRGDGGKRKYILVEMGDYFDTVLKPRIQKVIYSKDWKDGKPVSREGSSHLFKYLRLESYEDALNNLELKRTEAQDDLLRQHAPLREDYLLRYQLDVESAGSASLLAVAQFANPFAYQLKIATGSVGESRAVNVDLVETFNYLLGLRVSHTDAFYISRKMTQKAQKGGEAKAVAEEFSFVSSALFCGQTASDHKIQVVVGVNPAGEKILVLWRNALAVPNEAVDDFFQKQGYNTKDMEFAVIYVNGDNNLENLKRADETWKVRRIEDEFKRLMFDVQDV